MRSKLASSIAILLNYGAKWRALYYIFYVLLYDWEMNIVLSPRINSQIYYFHTGRPQPQANVGRTALLNLFGYTNPLKIVRFFNSFAALLVVVLLTISIHGVQLIFLRSGRSTWGLKNKKILSIVWALLNFNNWFTCFTISLYLDLLTCTTRDDVNQTISSSYIGRVEVKKRMQLLSKENCFSSLNFFLMVPTGFAALLSILLFVINRKMTHYSPEPRRMSKYGIGDTFHTLIMLMIIIIKVFALSLDIREVDPGWFYVVTSGLLFLDLVAQTVSFCFYDIVIERLEAFKTISLFVAALSRTYSWYTMEDSLNAKQLINMYFWLALAVCIIFRLFVSVRKERRNYRITNKSSMTRNILRLSYVLKEYIYSFDAPDGAKLNHWISKHLFEFMQDNKSFLLQKPALKEQLRLMLNSVENDFESRSTKGSIRSAQLHVLAMNKKYKLFYQNFASVEDSFEVLGNVLVKESLKLMDLLLQSVFGDGRTFTFEEKPTAMKSIYLTHLRNNQGRLIYALQLALKHREQAEGYFDKLNADILVEEIRLSIEVNLEKGVVLLPNIRTKVDFFLDQDTVPNLLPVVDLHNLLQDINKNILEAVQIKQKFYEVGEAENMFPGEFTKNSCVRMLYLHQKLETELGMARAITENRSTALQLVDCYYLLHVTLDLKQARRTLVALKERRFVDFLTPLHSEAGLMNLSQVVVVTVSGQPDNFHNITSVSSTCKQLTGYSIGQLEGANLNTIIPRPIQAFHEQFIKSINATGMIFEKKSDWRVLVLSKDQTVERAGLVVRMNNMLSSGIEFVGRINADPMYTHRERGMLLVDKDGKILELNRTASLIFRREESISYYNPELEEYVVEFFRASEFKSHNPKFEFEEVLASEKSLKDFKHYSNLTTGLKLNIRTHEGGDEQIHFRLVDFYVHRIKMHVMMLEFERCTSIEENLLLESSQKILGAWQGPGNNQTLGIQIIGAEANRPTIYKTDKSMRIVENLLALVESCTPIRQGDEDKFVSSSDLPYSSHIKLHRLDQGPFNKTPPKSLMGQDSNLSNFGSVKGQPSPNRPKAKSTQRKYDEEKRNRSDGLLAIIQAITAITEKRMSLSMNYIKNARKLSIKQMKQKHFILMDEVPKGSIMSSGQRITGIQNSSLEYKFSYVVSTLPLMKIIKVFLYGGYALLVALATFSLVFGSLSQYWSETVEETSIKQLKSLGNLYEGFSDVYEFTFSLLVDKMVDANILPDNLLTNSGFSTLANRTTAIRLDLRNQFLLDMMKNYVEMEGIDFSEKTKLTALEWEADAIPNLFHDTEIDLSEFSIMAFISNMQRSLISLDRRSGLSNPVYKATSDFLIRNMLNKLLGFLNELLSSKMASIKTLSLDFNKMLIEELIWHDSLLAVVLSSFLVMLLLIQNYFTKMNDEIFSFKREYVVMEKLHWGRCYSMYLEIIKDPQTCYEACGDIELKRKDYREEAEKFSAGKDKGNNHKRALKETSLRSVIKVDAYPINFFPFFIKTIASIALFWTFFIYGNAELIHLSKPLENRINLVYSAILLQNTHYNLLNALSLMSLQEYNATIYGSPVATEALSLATRYKTEAITGLISSSNADLGSELISLIYAKINNDNICQDAFEASPDVYYDCDLQPFSYLNSSLPILLNKMAATMERSAKLWMINRNNSNVGQMIMQDRDMQSIVALALLPTGFSDLINILLVTPTYNLVTLPSQRVNTPGRRVQYLVLAMLFHFFCSVCLFYFVIRVFLTDMLVLGQRIKFISLSLFKTSGTLTSMMRLKF